MSRTFNALLIAVILITLFAALAVGIAFVLPDMPRPLEIKSFIFTLSCLTLAIIVITFLPFAALRRERRAIRELADAVAARRGRIISGDLEELSRRIAVLLDEMNRGEKARETETTEMERTERLAAIGRLAAGLAHEIRNPITNVIGFADLALERHPDETLSRDLRTIREEARRCEAITDSILSFSRSPKIVPEPIEIQSLFHPVDGLNLTFDIPSDASGIVGDRTLLGRVMDNLLKNARDARATQAWVTVERAPAGRIIRVADNGSGIPVSALETLFDPFVTTKTGGLGLGLAISRGIISAHGGTIRASNRAEGGTVFEISLPVSPAKKLS
mgnify:CR=1 FL=1